ncbi:sigma-70 family RNA polymerase sigma factor [Novosphingobium beihaiensis]|uniref:Sigma-70 family RNA polymerase sigma factor n=1 Tax=Novosphingobium beihaiensis TaxID=2930389 RepID=A0ABT0BKR7_9SPHN|nr:sigma-70 family RNA polymerase sigma factor [Novosphingobium beihaiensis]MCJ2185634.1 sigma-70 family RNA polymerase sigma factor [Novosphingobium beihaiensis]
MNGDDATMMRLMRAAQNGDKQAYAVLLEQAAKWLRRYFRRRIALEKLDDLVQEVLLSVHAKRSTYDPDRPFYPWLAAIARYRWVDYLRAEYRTQTQELLEDTASEESAEEPVMARISLDRLFDQLSPAQAEAIELVKIEGYSVAEASERSGQSQSLIKVNVHRGIRKLAAIIEKAS